MGGGVQGKMHVLVQTTGSCPASVWLTCGNTSCQTDVRYECGFVLRTAWHSAVVITCHMRSKGAAAAAFQPAVPDKTDGAYVGFPWMCACPC